MSILKAKNPYLEEFREAFGSDKPQLFNFTSVRSNALSELNLSAGFRLRDKLTKKYAWAIPNDEALDCIARHGPIVEIGAGGGYWASLLWRMDVDIVAFDNRSTHQDGRITHWHTVEYGDHKKAAQYPDRTLLLVWPPYDTDCAEYAARRYKGETIIYVGEKNGCTGTEDFEVYLGAQWSECEVIDIPQWPGLHDYLRVFQRKPTSDSPAKPEKIRKMDQSRSIDLDQS